MTLPEDPRYTYIYIYMYVYYVYMYIIYIYICLYIYTHTVQFSASIHFESLVGSPVASFSAPCLWLRQSRGESAAWSNLKPKTRNPKP